MKKLDEFVFSKIDQFEDGPLVQQFNDFITGIDERYQKLVSTVVSLFLAFFPMALLLVVFLCTNIISKDVKSMQGLSDKIELYKEIKQLNKESTDQLFAVPPYTYGTFDEFNRFITSLSSGLALDADQLVVVRDRFTNIETSNPNIKIVQNFIDINNFTYNELTALIDRFAESKMRLQEANLAVNQDKLLNGYVSVVQMFLLSESLNSASN